MTCDMGSEIFAPHVCVVFACVVPCSVLRPRGSNLGDHQNIRPNTLSPLSHNLRIILSNMTFPILSRKSSLHIRLLRDDIPFGSRRVRRLMRKMRIIAVQPRRNLTHGTNAKYIKSYLLRKLNIYHPGQVCSIDITYIPMEKGFMYLTAIIDVYSRAIMVWGSQNALDGANSIEVLDGRVPWQVFLAVA